MFIKITNDSSVILLEEIMSITSVGYCQRAILEKKIEGINYYQWLIAESDPECIITGSICEHVAAFSADENDEEEYNILFGDRIGREEAKLFSSCVIGGTDIFSSFIENSMLFTIVVFIDKSGNKRKFVAKKDSVFILSGEGKTIDRF